MTETQIPPPLAPVDVLIAKFGKETPKDLIPPGTKPRIVDLPGPNATSLSVFSLNHLSAPKHHVFLNTRGVMSLNYLGEVDALLTGVHQWAVTLTQKAAQNPAESDDPCRESAMALRRMHRRICSTFGKTAVFKSSVDLKFPTAEFASKTFQALEKFCREELRMDTGHGRIYLTPTPPVLASEEPSV